MTTKVDPGSSSPLIAPAPVLEPGEIDLEAGQGEQLQCRICLETDGDPSRSTFPSQFLHFFPEFPGIIVSLNLTPISTPFDENCGNGGEI